MGRMILAIETSNPSAGGEGGAGVALVRWDQSLEVVDAETLRATGRHDDDLMPAIDRLFARTGVTRAAIARVAVSIGPGGYTGLRVAVTTASAIGETCRAEVVGVPTALALNRRSRTPGPRMVCLAVKGRSVWAHRFPEGEGAVIAVEALVGTGLGGVVADRFLPEDVRAALSAEGVVIEAPRYDAVAVAEASVGLPAGGPVRALYAREPEAVTRWRERGR